MKRTWTVSAVLAVLAMSLTAGAGLAADPYPKAEIDRAAAFIAKMDQDKRDMLGELAKKTGMSVERTFLDIVQVTGGATLGMGTSNGPDQPDDDGTFTALKKGGMPPGLNKR